MMTNFFRDGGWGMYPTTIFGVLLVAASLAYAIFPQRRFVPLVVSMGVVTFGSGCLGCVTGFVNTFRYVGEVAADKQHAITLLGIAESLNNVVLAFMFLVFTSLIVSVGALRQGLSKKEAAAEAPKA